MSGNILDVLSHPAAADPDFYNKGLQNLNALRDTQAKQAIADITQQSVDPQGRVDPAKFNLLLSQNPKAAWAGLPALRSTQELQGQQITQQGQTLEQNLAKAKWANAAAGSLTRLGPNITQQDAISALHDGLIQGILTPTEYQRQVAQLPSDAAGLHAWASQHQFTAMSVQQQLEQSQGTQQTITTPGATYIQNVPPISAGKTIVVPHGPAPGTTTVTSEPYDKDGIIPRDANGVPTRKPDGYTDVTKPVTAVPGVPQGGPPQITPAPGSAPAAAPPAGLPPGAPPPLPGQRLVGGRFVTPPAAPAPVPTPPPAPSQPPAAAPPPVSTSTTLRGPGSPATPPGAMPPAIKTPPQGQPELLAKDNEVRTQANLAMEDQQKRLIAGNSALEALKLADTGPSTGFFARAYAFLKAQGITTVERGQLSDTDYRQLLQKNLLRFAQSSSRTAGTDLGLETQIHSNANVDDMLAGANRHVLIQDLGVLKRSIAQTQEMPTSGPAGSVVKHVGEFSANTAPEAFMWNHYTPEERAAVEAQYARDGKTKQLHDSLELAVRRGAIPDPRKAAPAARPAVAAPPPNPLVPTD